MIDQQMPITLNERQHMKRGAKFKGETED